MLEFFLRSAATPELGFPTVHLGVHVVGSHPIFIIVVRLGVPPIKFLEGHYINFPNE